MIRLSIITPHYNMPKTLKRLSESIPDRDWIEHIIVDDKSDTDPTAIDEAKQFVLNRGARWFDNTTDIKGTGICRDTGIENASGEWILIADADDYFVDGAFDLIEKHLDDQADIIYFTPTSKKEENGLEGSSHIPYHRLVSKYVENKSRENELRLRYLCVADTCKLIRREIIVSRGIKSSYTVVANDVMFSTGCAFYAQKIEAFNDVIYCIMERPGTLTRTKNVQWLRQRIDIYSEQCSFLRERLPKDSFDDIGLSASGLLLQCYRDYGIIETLRGIHTLRRNKAPVDLLDLKTRKS